MIPHPTPQKKNTSAWVYWTKVNNFAVLKKKLQVLKLIFMKANFQYFTKCNCTDEGFKGDKPIYILLD